MTMESAISALGKTRADSPTGFRRLTPNLLKSDRAAEQFDGLPDGVTMHGQLLAAFKAAAPCLGTPPRLVHAIDWLFRFTQPQDWGRGGRPIVWPSAETQQVALGVSPTQAKAINRALIEAGLLTMKDSPNGKRYGKRDREGRIIEAYGFDLSPLAARHAEFVKLAREAKTARADMARLRRRATIAKNGIVQILETAVEYSFEGDEWTRLAEDSRNLSTALRQVERLEEMALGVESLERRQRAARERLETLLSAITVEPSEAVDSVPLGPENRPHQYTYNSSLNPQEDTVVAFEKCSPGGGKVSENDQAPALPQEPQGKRTDRAERTDSGTVMKLSSAEIAHLAPRMRDYLRSSAPSWPDIVDAADWLRQDLGVSKTLWGEACVAMGREEAAIALAIVSAKPADYFRTSPGGYFYGMVAKAKTGELNLGRTIWALRDATASGQRGKQGRGGGNLRT